MARRVSAELEGTEFESRFHHLLALWLALGELLTSESLDFSICKMGIMAPSAS